MSGALPLRGRRAVITGGGKGIGRAIARRLAADGARIGLIGRDAAALEETRALILRQPPLGWEMEWPCDWLVDCAVADITDPTALAGALVQMGEIDILISNAGAAISLPFRSQDEESWQTMIEINLTAAYRLFQQVLPPMRARGNGRIIAIASTAGLKGYSHAAAYCASKHGLIGLVRALAREFTGSGVTLNAVCPGFTETEMLDRAIINVATATRRTIAEARQSLLGFNPARRAILPDEVAECVAWLCQHAARSITGQAIPVCDGEI